MYWYGESGDWAGIDWAVMVPDTKRSKRDPDGVCCARCKDFYYMAEPNQEDGTLVCYLCRTNPFRPGIKM